jgi:hypothetical protein
MMPAPGGYLKSALSCHGEPRKLCANMMRDQFISRPGYCCAVMSLKAFGTYPSLKSAPVTLTFNAVAVQGGGAHLAPSSRRSFGTCTRQNSSPFGPMVLRFVLLRATT